MIKSTLDLPDSAIQSISKSVGVGAKSDPVELQSQLIRFSDHYLDTINAAFAELRKADDKRPDRRTLLRQRIAAINDVLAIATGSNAYANLLDMIILVTLNRNNAHSWFSELYGDSAKSLIIISQDSEKEIWRIAEGTLTKKQIEELRNNIEEWRTQNLGVRMRPDVGTLGLSSEIAKMHKTSQTDNTSVFNLLKIDPFSGLDPATRELANTRLFAERGLFLTRHMPTLLRLESELLVIQSMNIPQLEVLVQSINQLSLSAERFSMVTEQLPAVISGEREQLVQALDSQRPGLISLAAQTEKALIAGQLMSEATNATLKTFQDIVKQLADSPSDPNSKPFDIEDYTKLAAEINVSAQQLTKLMEQFGSTLNQERFNELSEKVDLLSERFEASGRNAADYAFKKLLLLGMVLITFICILFLITSVLYWRLKKRFTEEKTPSKAEIIE